jgi:hypothetical protein
LRAAFAKESKNTGVIFHAYRATFSVDLSNALALITFKKFPTKMEVIKNVIGKVDRRSVRINERS